MRLEIHWIPNSCDLSCSTSSISGWKTNRLPRKDNSPCGFSSRLAATVGWPPRGEPGQAETEPASAGACRQLLSPPPTRLSVSLPSSCQPRRMQPSVTGRGCPPCLLCKGPQVSLGPSKGKVAKNQPCCFLQKLRETGGLVLRSGRGSSEVFSPCRLLSPHLLYDSGLAEPPAPIPGK